MADIFLKSGSGALQLSNRAWSLGSRMVPATGDASSNVAVARAWVWECTTAGSTTGTPTWPAAVTQDVTTVTQNSVVFTARKPGYSSGSTRSWSFATILLDYALLAAAAGDYVRVSGFHAESIAGTTRNFTSAGTLGNPVFVTTVDDSVTSGWTSISSPSSVTAGAGGAITFNGCTSYENVNFTSAGNFTFNSSGNQTVLKFNTCAFVISGSGASSVSLGNGTPVTEIEWTNCSMKFGATTQRMVALKCKFTWNGGSWASGGSTPVNIFTATSTAADSEVTLNGVDLSNLGSAVNMVQSTPTTSLTFIANRCRMPSSWSGALFSATPNSIAGLRGEMHNCVNSTSELPQKWIENPYGTVKASAVVTRSGYSSDESLALTATTNAIYPGFSARTEWYSKPNTTTGVSVNFSAYCITNAAAAPTNAELALEVQVRSTSGSPLATLAGDYPADSATAATTQTADTSDWTAGTVAARANSQAYAVGAAIKLASNPGRVFFCTASSGNSAASEPAGYATAVDGDSVTDGSCTFRAGWRQKLDVSVTPQETGFVLWRAHFNKQSATTYLDRYLVAQ